MKGQFYLIAALAFIILLFTFLPQRTPLLSSPSADLPFLARNLQHELPRSLTFSLNESAGVTKLINFTQFSQSVLSAQAINASILWVVASNVSSDVNVTVGNFIGSTETFSLTIGGSTQQLVVTANATNSTTFTSPGSAFNLSIAFRDVNDTVSWSLGKISLYGFFNLSRFDDNYQATTTA